MHPALLTALYLAVTLLPLGLAWSLGWPPRPMADELASAAGMLSFAVILVEFVLSGRFRAVSGRIGMDVTMRLHQLFARSALALALIHPFLYTTPFNPARPWDVTRQLSLTPDFGAIGTGAAAWLILFVLVLHAINRDRLDYRYETWRLMHGLGAALAAGLLLHHTLTAGRYSQEPAIALTWAVLFAIAVATLLAVYVIGPLLQIRRPWRVASITPAGLRSWTLTLEPEGHGGVEYEAGQFFWINLGHSPFSVFENPFSASSAPGSGPALEFLIKELGDFTGSLGDVAIGTRAHVDGPHGTLTLAGRNEPGIAFIAGGIGVAPLLGLLRQLRIERDPRPTVLVYGNRVAEQIVCADELAELERVHGTRVVHVLSSPAPDWTGPVGMIGPALIRELFGGEKTRRWLYVMCGPPAMMESVEDTLIELGVPAHRIISERFRYD